MSLNSRLESDNEEQEVQGCEVHTDSEYGTTQGLLVAFRSTPDPDFCLGSSTGCLQPPHRATHQGVKISGSAGVRVGFQGSGFGAQGVELSNQGCEAVPRRTRIQGS